MGWVLVTGGAKGLGAELCCTLAKNGHSILVHYRSSAQEVDKVVGSCRACGVQAESVQGDFATMEDVKAFLIKVKRDFPKVSSLVNNVGNIVQASALETDPELWADLFQTNLHAPYALIHGLIPSIKTQRGSIVNIGVAGVGTLKSDTNFTAYSATKLALLHLTKSLARELAPAHVRVNMVSPGETEGSVTLRKDPSLLPMGRVATRKEVAEIVAMLLDVRYSYVTGQNIEVSGGYAL